jgi:hypothetical protein
MYSPTRPGARLTAGRGLEFRLDQMGQAALHADGVAAQSGEAGGSGVRSELLPWPSDAS